MELTLQAGTEDHTESRCTTDQSIMMSFFNVIKKTNKKSSPIIIDKVSFCELTTTAYHGELVVIVTINI